jgi:hypothetical protein
MPSAEKHKLSAITRNASERGDLIEITEESMATLLESGPPAWDVEIRSRFLLRHLARMCRYPSGKTQLPYESSYPLAYAHNAGELAYYVQQLKKRGVHYLGQRTQ